MGLTRETRVRIGFGHLYPEIRPGWDSAALTANRVSERVVARLGYAAILKARVLPETHFEFRGGSNTRPGGRRSRISDGKR